MLRLLILLLICVVSGCKTPAKLVTVDATVTAIHPAVASVHVCCRIER